MSAAKNQEQDQRGGNRGGLVGRGLRALRGRVTMIAWATALGTIAICGRLIWNHVHEHVAAQDDYRLTVRDISITPPPPWIRADVKEEVVHNGLSGAPLSILDEGLVERIHSVFSLHPWVAKVERVTKSHPAHVEVEIIYRRPVAMVQVPGGWYPVDVEGVLLPIDDFSPTDTNSYPRLTGIESSPIGGTGAKWGDTVVVGGARIAENLAPLWSELGLRGIHWLKPTAGSDPSAPAIFELITAAGNVLPWGAAPGSEPTGEPASQQKVLRLKAYIARHGSLDDPASGPRDLDLRRSDAAPRTAARPQDGL
jgi:hypothetical protein